MDFRGSCFFQDATRIAAVHASTGEDAERLFVLSHRWLLVKRVPETVQMTAEDFCLWIKLGRFCSSI